VQFLKEEGDAMALEISRREVLNNLIRFKESLAEMRGEREGHEEHLPAEKKKERKYKVLMNRKTGDMRFAQKISSFEHHIGRKSGKKEAPEDWKEIQLIVHQQVKSEAAHFEVLDSQNRSLKPSELEPLAWRVASETLDVLNQKAEEVKGQLLDMLPEEAALYDLSSIHISSMKDRINDLPGWLGSISRLDAEQMLDGKPEGTYLLREGDELTIAIAFHFEEENHLHIHPYLVTVIEGEGKISDILFLQTSKGWILYFDNPNLNDRVLYEYFPSAQALLQHIKQTAKRPLC
jgi:hypothetical protein